jgi:hypothetical protein
MTQPQKNTALALAIVAGVMSLPLPWMTIRGATIQSGPGHIFHSASDGLTIDVTGLNGHVTLLFKTPIWFIVGVAIAASVLQLMHHSGMFAVPRFAEWLTSIIAVAWVAPAIIVAMLSGKTAPGLGLLLGLAAAVIPVVCLTIPAPKGDLPS